MIHTKDDEGFLRWIGLKLLVWKSQGVDVVCQPANTAQRR